MITLNQKQKIINANTERVIRTLKEGLVGRMTGIILLIFKEH